MEQSPVVTNILRRTGTKFLHRPITVDEKLDAFKKCDEHAKEIRDLNGQIGALVEQTKTLKKRVDGIQAEVAELTIKWNGDTVEDQVAVVVERNPSKPAEVLVWQVPEYATADEILAEDIPAGVDLESFRLAQHCELVESRAMHSDELRAAEEEDWRLKHPELPFPDAGRPFAKVETDADGDLIDEAPKDDAGAAPDPREEAGAGSCLTCSSRPGEPHSDDCEDAGARVPAAAPEPREDEPGVRLVVSAGGLLLHRDGHQPELVRLTMEPVMVRPTIEGDKEFSRITLTLCSDERVLATADTEDEAAVALARQLADREVGPGDAATPTHGANGTSKRKASPKPKCPYLVTVGSVPLEDEICGADGSTKSGGFCPAHRDITGIDRSRAITRRAGRQQAEREAKKAAANGSEKHETA